MLFQLFLTCEDFLPCLFTHARFSIQCQRYSGFRDAKCPGDIYGFYIHVEAPYLFITTVFIVQLTTVYFKPFKHFISNLFSVQGYNNQN